MGALRDCTWILGLSGSSTATSPYVNELRRCLILSDNTKKRRAALAGEPHHYACAQADGQTTVGRSRRGAVPNASLSRVRRIAPLK